MATQCNKRPCRICRKWFAPNPKLKERQMTCGDPACKKEWHKKTCRKWNRNNRDYFRANYLQEKLTAASNTASKSQPKRAGLSRSGLPLEFVQEVMGVQHWIIVEYLAQLLVRRFQEALRRQAIVNEGQTAQLPPASP
jgi:hypothetical protein